MEFALHSSVPVTMPSEDRQLILSLIQHLEDLHRTTKTLGLSTHDIEDALAQVKNQTLSLVVVGEFKRGKSTFINALLGQDILPSDILPTTATINRVVFGSTPSATIRFKDGRDHSIAIEQLANYVTKLTSEAEALSGTVQEALIYYPLHYCRNGVEIIDTPGLSDDSTMTAVTLSVLRRTEVVIMVTSAISPFAQSEGEFLKTLLEQGINHILFVVNGIDHCKTAEDIDRVLQEITRRIKQCISNWAEDQMGKGSSEYDAYLERMGAPRIYGLSSQQALQGKRTGDVMLLERSRFEPFEAALNSLLVEERQRISLQLSVESAIAAASQILNTVQTQHYALQVQQQSVTRKRLSIIENLSMLRMESREELNHLDRGINAIESEVATILYALSYRLEQAAEQAIDNTSVNTSNSLNEITSHFSDQIVTALKKVQSSVESDITKTINRETEKQRLELKRVLNSINQQICRIQEQCLQLGITLTPQDSVHQDCNIGLQNGSKSIANLLTLEPNLFFIQEQAKGGYTVAGAVIGSFFGGFGAPVGAALGASLGEHRRKQTFKQSYKPEVLSVIKTKLNLQTVNQKVNQYVIAATSGLRTAASRVRQQTETIVDSIERNIAAFQGKQEAEMLAEQKRLEQLMLEMQKILEDSHLLLNRLD